MIGQKNLQDKLSRISLKSFTHSLLILGEKGSGKHTLASVIANNLNIPLTDITENISDDLLLTLATKSLPGMYLIDISDITEKQQNIILKFVEEPTENIFIVILGEDTISILPTILNRCQVIHMEQYTREELLNFNKDEVALSLVHTPGKLLTVNNASLSTMIKTCSDYIDNISLLSFTRALKITQRINYKDEFDKFDIDLFFAVIESLLFKKVALNVSNTYYDCYMLTVKERKKLLDKRISLSTFMQNYITKLWEVAHSVTQ